MTDDTLLEQLDTALGAVLTARVAAGGVEAPSVPDDAFDGALGADDGYQQARAKVREALDGLRKAVDPPTWQAILQYEAAANESMAEAVEVAWTLAWKAAAGR